MEKDVSLEQALESALRTRPSKKHSTLLSTGNRTNFDALKRSIILLSNSLMLYLQLIMKNCQKFVNTCTLNKRTTLTLLAGSPAWIIWLNIIAYSLFGHGFLPSGDVDIMTARAIVLVVFSLIGAITFMNLS